MMLGRAGNILLGVTSNCFARSLPSSCLHTAPKKRFYKSVSVVQSNGKFEINLGRKEKDNFINWKLLSRHQRLSFCEFLNRGHTICFSYFSACAMLRNRKFCLSLTGTLISYLRFGTVIKWNYNIWHSIKMCILFPLFNIFSFTFYNIYDESYQFFPCIKAYTM